MCAVTQTDGNWSVKESYIIKSTHTALNWTRKRQRIEVNLHICDRTKIIFMMQTNILLEQNRYSTNFECLSAY